MPCALIVQCNLINPGNLRNAKAGLMAYFVQVVEIDRLYGGPEEGGWWYDWYTVRFHKRTTKRLAKKLAKRLMREVCEDCPTREVALNLPLSCGCQFRGNCPKCRATLRKGRKGRNRFSVIGEADMTVSVTRYPVQSTTRRPCYE